MNPDASDIEATAAQWFSLRNAGMSAEQAEAFRRWLAEDERHPRVFAELEQTWHMLQGLKSALPARTWSGPPDPDVLAHPRKRRLRSVVPLMAMAAAIALVGFFVWQMAIRTNEEIYVDEVITAKNHFQRLLLPDGSILKVNSDSYVRVHYTARERHTELLRGEAHFIVAKNPQRPFLVEARGTAVRAVGTAFNVKLDTHSVEVVVTEGKVRVNERSPTKKLPESGEVTPPPLLVPGDKAIIPAPLLPRDNPSSIKITHLPPEALQSTLAWQNQRLEFLAAPLSHIIAEFNRFNRIQMRIEDTRLSSQRFGGSFRADEPEEFLRLLETRFGVTVEKRDGEMVLNWDNSQRIPSSEPAR